MMTLALEQGQLMMEKKNYFVVSFTFKRATIFNCPNSGFDQDSYVFYVGTKLNLHKPATWSKLYTLRVFEEDSKI
jgi:hypothetical protein